MSIGLQEGNLFAERYRVLGRLGSGGNGAVYEAVHVETARRRALKVLHSHKLEQPEARERFRHEARVTAHIASEHVVEVIDAGIDDATGTPFLVMELLQGEDLGQRLRRVGRFPPEEALRYLHHTALALEETHRASIVHRDLKPGNLFLAERPGLEPIVKVLDFGAAKIVADSVTSGETGALGTLLYMAPEQIRRRSLSPATDIYALGMTAYTLLIGQAYWADEKRENGDPIAFAMIAVRGPRELASARAARSGVALPPALDAWFARATALQPSGRFASAMEAVHMLADVFGLPRPASAQLSRVPGRTSGRSEPPISTHESRDDSLTARPDAGMGGDDLPPSHRNSATLSDTKTLPSNARPESRLPSTRDEAAQDQEVARARRRALRRKPARAATFNGMVLAALGAVFPDHRFHAPVLPPQTESALLSPSPSLACAIFEASVDEKPAGWLGAAAATMACERARVILGGSRARTLIPAELLNLPDPSEQRLPVDPYGGPDARQTSLANARGGAAAYIDGRVIKEAYDFRVSLALHQTDSGVLVQGEGKGRSLHRAVRDAMKPLFESKLLPQAEALDPEVAQWSPARDIDTALALLDLTFALSQSAGGLAEECDRVANKSADLGAVGPAAAWLCAHAQGRRAPEIPVPPIDQASLAAYVTHIRLADWIYGENVGAHKANLDRRGKQQEEKSLGRDVIDGTQSCLLPSSAPEAVRREIHLVTQGDPKRPLGELCILWPELMAKTWEASSPQEHARILQLWAPWSTGAWNAEPSEDYLERAHVLSPLDTNTALNMARFLFSRSDLEKERELAGGLAAGDEPVHWLVGDLVLTEVDAAETHLSAAFKQASGAMETADAADAADWVRAMRFDAAWHAVEIGWALGRGEEIADRVIKRSIVPKLEPLDVSGSELPSRLVTLCVLASEAMSRPCANRFRELRGQLSGGNLAAADTLDNGLDRFINGDRGGAVTAWRPLLLEGGVFGPMMLDALASTFERGGGDRDLSKRLETLGEMNAKQFGGTSPTLVGMARRARKRGDLLWAEKLAGQVFNAWSKSNENEPAVKEMQTLLKERRQDPLEDAD